MVVLKSDLLLHLKILKQYYLLAKGEFYHLFLEEACEMMGLPPSETSERDINQGPFLNAASRLGMEENPFFKKCRLRLQSFKFKYDNFGSISGLALIGSCHLHHNAVVMKSSSRHTGALWHTLKQQVGNGFKMGFNVRFQVASVHPTDRMSMISANATPR